ncbi:MAG: PD40 domain-containing protein [Candidatus Aminicenantes bacterium]|nr:PD40 domain-containing protein [Candidatus Aminicenantes bacterium]
MKRIYPVALLFLCAVFVFPLSAVDTKDTLLLHQPAISANKIAFVYADDLWTANIDGSEVRQLTTDEGVETSPAFSPDGKWIAFSAQYDGNLDVFLIPAEGGIPKRLTWHPTPDIVRGFAPDGKSVIFISNRDQGAGTGFPFLQLFSVSVNGGFPENLKLPSAFFATFSPDGKHIAYTPRPPAYEEWKHYRGGTTSRIWLIDMSDYSVVQIPQPEGRCNDAHPMWLGDKIYFLSDREGEFNLFVFDTKSEKIQQLTSFKDFPIIDASASGTKILFEREGYLNLYDIQQGQSTKLTIGVAADLQEVRPRYVKGPQYIRNGDISPSGSRAVLEFRGEIITVPAEKGDPRNITETQGANERYPVWSPDGKWIAYFGDASGEYELFIAPQDGKGKARTIKPIGSGFYYNPVWSPDSKKIAYRDYAQNFYLVDVASGDIKKIANEPHLGIDGMYYAWSPDSQWITYTLQTPAYLQRVYLYSLKQDKSYPVTDGLSDVTNPVFDKSGKYLYFFGSTDSGPVKDWFAMSTADMEMKNGLYMAVLKKGELSPLAKESDEEKVAEEKKEEPKKDEAKAGKEEKPEKKEEGVAIDIEGIDLRILSLPVAPGPYDNLQAGDEGQIFYLEFPILGMALALQGPPSAKLNKFDLKTKKSETIAEGIMDYKISADGKKLLYRTMGMAGIAPTAGKIQPGQGKLNIEAIEVRIVPRAEWQQIYKEGWRLNRDSFYATNMHGADWNAVYTKYEKFIPHLACRNDLNRVFTWMGSELAVGHHFTGGGDFLFQPKRVPGGLLGADYALENGRYRFKKVYGGLNWNPDMRSPLTEPGVDIAAGEYLLKVNGEELSAADNIFSKFENTADKIVEIAVGPNPDGTGSRTVSVVPIRDEGTLRHRDWLEGNIAKVDKATGGRVAYVYVPNTTLHGHIYFKRYFYPQVDKEAIIVDERYNGGGQVADYYIDLLRRPYIAHWHTRYGEDIKTPNASIQGPKVLLINELAGSGGDLFPYMFRKFKLGKLIGKRTWGGLVGNLNHPPLMDGGSVTAPNLGFWTEEEGWAVENVGVPPDIEVEEWPAEVNAGHDPQLEMAIKVIMEELAKNPPKKPKRPPYPVRVKK